MKIFFFFFLAQFLVLKQSKRHEKKWNNLQDMDIVSDHGDGKATVSTFKKKREN